MQFTEKNNFFHYLTMMSPLETLLNKLNQIRIGLETRARINENRDHNRRKSDLKLSILIYFETKFEHLKEIRRRKVGQNLKSRKKRKFLKILIMQ